MLDPNAMHLLAVAGAMTLDPPGYIGRVRAYADPLCNAVARDLVHTLQRAGHPTPAALVRAAIDGGDTAGRDHRALRDTLPDPRRAIGQYDALWAYGHGLLQRSIESHPYWLAAWWIRHIEGRSALDT